MKFNFNEIVDRWNFLMEDATPPPPPPPGMDDGMGGGNGGGEESSKPCFADSTGVVFLFGFISVYNKIRRDDHIPSSITSFMISKKGVMDSVSEATAKRFLRLVFRKFGITEYDEKYAIKCNNASYKKESKNGDKPEVRMVDKENYKEMVDIIGMIGSKARKSRAHDMAGGSSTLTEVGFDNMRDFDFKNIWNAYNRIVANEKGLYKPGI